MPSATMKRLAAMQDCPLLMVRALTAVEMASSRSALGITMKGSLPPSSSTVFLMRSPHWAATERPAGSLPVRVGGGPRTCGRTGAGRLAAGESGGGHAIVGQYGRGLSRADEQRLKRAIREARAAQDVFDGQSA